MLGPRVEVRTLPEEIEKTSDGDKVGSVSASRYAEIVAELRKLVETASRIQFAIGDYALEVEPMRECGGQEKSEAPFTVKESLFRLAEDIGVSYSRVNQTRWTASRWPQDRQVAGVSYTVHRILAGIADEEERSKAIGTPPAGKSRWTPDEANRRAGRQVVKPVTPQEKVSAIHTLAKDEEGAATVTGDLLRRPAMVAQVKPADKVRAVEELSREDEVAAAVAPDILRRPAVVAKVKAADEVKVVEELTRDETVAAEVATGLLRRPDVAFKAMGDDTARHQVNRAQAERGQQAARASRRTTRSPRRSARSTGRWSSSTSSPPATCSSRRPAGSSRACATGSLVTTNASWSTRTSRGCGPPWTVSRRPSTPGRSTSTANWPGSCKANSRCHALPSADRLPPSGTPTPSGSCSSRPARPV